MTIGTLKELNRTHLTPAMVYNALILMREQNELVTQILAAKSCIVSNN